MWSRPYSANSDQMTSRVMMISKMEGLGTKSLHGLFKYSDSELRTNRQAWLGHMTEMESVAADGKERILSLFNKIISYE